MSGRERIPQGILTAGVDEVGRGPLAGAVVAAAVILDPENPIEGLADSKALTERARERLAIQIRERALCWAIGRAEHDEIDRINIRQATLQAMARAVAALAVRPALVLVDGNDLPPLPCVGRAVIGGDATVAAISAASILAKVARDTEMIALDERYPGYGFGQHKGYPTAAHIRAIRELGVTAIHRKSFSPVSKVIKEKQ